MVRVAFMAAVAVFSLMTSMAAAEPIRIWENITDTSEKAPMHPEKKEPYWKLFYDFAIAAEFELEGIPYADREYISSNALAFSAFQEANDKGHFASLKSDLKDQATLRAFTDIYMSNWREANGLTTESISWGQFWNGQYVLLDETAATALMQQAKVNLEIATLETKISKILDKRGLSGRDLDRVKGYQNQITALQESHKRLASRINGLDKKIGHLTSVVEGDETNPGLVATVSALNEQMNGGNQRPGVVQQVSALSEQLNGSAETPGVAKQVASHDAVLNGDEKSDGIVKSVEQLEDEARKMTLIVWAVLIFAVIAIAVIVFMLFKLESVQKTVAQLVRKQTNAAESDAQEVHPKVDGIDESDDSEVVVPPGIVNKVKGFELEKKYPVTVEVAGESIEIKIQRINDRYCEVFGVEGLRGNRQVVIDNLPSRLRKAGKQGRVVGHKIISLDVKDKAA